MAGRAVYARGKSRCQGRGSKLQRLLSAWRPGLSLALAGVLLGSGCTRPFYRKGADKEVSEVLANKDKFAEWKIDNWHVYPDPRARYADNSDPDHPAKPPDDPASYCMSPNPQKAGKPGVERIEGNGYLELLANWDKENREQLKQDLAAENPQEPATADAGERKPGDLTIGLPPEPKEAAKVLDALKKDENQPSNAQMAGPMGQMDAIAEAKARSLLDITGRPTYLLALDQAW